MSDLQDQFHREAYRFTCGCIDANIEHSAKCVATAKGVKVWTSECEHKCDGPHIVKFNWDENGYSTEVWCDAEPRRTLTEENNDG